MSENVEDTKLIKGFNAGYELSKHEPELFRQITKNAGDDDPYLRGLLLGGQQYDRDKILEQLKSKSKSSKRDLDR